MNYVLVDIGNTSIKAKIFNKKNEELSSLFVSKSDESLVHFFSKLKNIDNYLISSVVPEINERIIKLKKKNIRFLKTSDFDELDINVKPPESVGIDRLVNAIAIKYKWDANVLVVDMGTVTTFCQIEKGGKYEGGIIFPGFQMITNSLNEKTAQLPIIQFPLKEPNLVGTSTKEAIESGLFNGGIAMINGVIKKVKKKNTKVAVVLTGGVPSSLLKHIKHDVFEKDLQFIGLDILYKKLFKY